MSKPNPFPAITGSCVCSTVRYRLLTSPLFCYACHCADCQKATGSAFGLFLNIEIFNIRIISPNAPIAVIREKKPGVFDRHVECPRCKAELWSNNAHGDAIADVRVGTLDFPSLMEPDVHIFVESKLDWVVLPEGAKTMKKEYELKESWPKSSLKRLDLCLQRTEEMKKAKEAAAAAATVLGRGTGDVAGQEVDAEEAGGEGEKTPTAVEPGDQEIEDDEAFETRFRETEKALQERLEKLSLKLEEEEVTKKMEQTAIE